MNHLTVHAPSPQVLSDWFQEDRDDDCACPNALMVSISEPNVNIRNCPVQLVKPHTPTRR
jgi:hypothetical protein